MDHHDDRREPAPPHPTDPDTPRERPTDRDWNAAGGDPDASSVLGGTSSHQRPSFNDPAAGNLNPIIGTSGLAAQEIAGTQSPVAREGSGDGWLENPVDQGGFGTRGSEGASGRDSDEAAERARRRDSDGETRDQS